MKKLIGIILSALFLLAGCNENNSILEPESSNGDPSQLDKGRPILNLDLDDGDDFDKLYYLYDDSLNYGGNIFLRGEDEDSKELNDYSDLDGYKTKYSQNFTINGSVGGNIGVKHEWINENGERVRLVSYLRIPAGAFEGDLTFDMIFDVENNSMELYPSPFSFDLPVDFSMYWYGLDLEGFDNSEFEFGYLDGEGEEIICKRKYADVSSGTLVVQSAQLHHFSRYGWTRTRK